MILAGQFNEFLIVAVIAVLVIAIGLLVYYIVTGRKKDEVNLPTSESKNVAVTNPTNYEIKNEVKENNNYVQNEVISETQNALNTNIESKETYINQEKALEEEKTDNSIQTLLNQMQEDLDKSSNESYEDQVARYEDEEEENAIISYKELIKYKESLEKKMVLEDKDKEEIKEIIKENSEEEPKEEVKKFKRSEFISPIFGYNEDTNVTYREIKRPPRKEVKLPTSTDEWESDRMLKSLEDDAAEVIEFEERAQEKDEIDKNDSFLDALVDFRNKLN